MGKEKTVGGMTAASLTKNKHGKVVSKKLSTVQEEPLDCCRRQGKEGTWPQGLRRYQERLRSLQEGPGVLQLSGLAWLQLGLWGYLQPWSAEASNRISSVEHHR